MQEEKSRLRPLTCIHCSIPYTAVKSNDLCSDCRKEIDPYFEMSFELIFVDLILGRGNVYRHLLVNRWRNGNTILALKLILAIIVAEWSYRIKLSLHPPDEAAQATNDVQTNSTSIFNSSYSPDLMGEEELSSSQSHYKKSIEFNVILGRILGELPENYQETFGVVALQFLLVFIVTIALTKLIYANTFNKRNINIKQVILAVALSQACRIALLIYAAWRDVNGICFQVIALYSYFLLVVSLKGLFEHKHFILPLIIVGLVFTIKSTVFALYFNQPLSLEVDKTGEL